MFFVLPDIIDQAQATSPDRIALRFETQSWTYGVLANRIRALADGLRGLGITRGDRVVICAGNHPDAIVAFWAGHAIGACMSIIASDQPGDKIDYILRDSGARVLIIHNRILGRVDDRLADIPDLSGVVVIGAAGPLRAGLTAFEAVLGDPDAAVPRNVRPIGVDLACIIYTSGSTGEPKGVTLTHQNMVAALASLTAYLGYRATDTVLCMLPISFDYGLYQIIMTFAVGATLVLEPEGQLPPAILRSLQNHRCTVLPGISTLFHLLDRYAAMGSFDLSSVRMVTNTGMALQAQHIEILKRLLPKARIFSMYGLTECKRCTYLPPEDLDRKQGSVGIAIPNTEIMVVDETGKPCPAGAVGELVVRGQTVMQGYWRSPEETARKIRAHPIFGDRCLFTGDYGWLDEEGYFHFTGRKDDIVKIRGRKVIVGEIEKAVYEHANVQEAAVVVATGADGEDAIVAFYAARGTTAESDLRQHCGGMLEAYQVPHVFVPVTGLPRNVNGKIDRHKLKQQFESRHQKEGVSA